MGKRVLTIPPNAMGLKADRNKRMTIIGVRCVRASQTSVGKLLCGIYFAYLSKVEQNDTQRARRVQYLHRESRTHDRF